MARSGMESPWTRARRTGPWACPQPSHTLAYGWRTLARSPLISPLEAFRVGLSRHHQRGFVEEVEAQLEELHVAEAIGLPLSTLDFCCSAPPGVPAKSGAQRNRSPGRWESACRRAREVSVVQLRASSLHWSSLSGSGIRQVPEHPKVLLQQVGLVEGFVDRH